VHSAEVGIESTELNHPINSLNEMTHSGIINSYDVMKAFTNENSIIQLNNNWENSVITRLTKINFL
jgi:hypothetical protein